MAVPKKRAMSNDVGGSLQVPCKACGAPLIFAQSEDTGKTIPLDVRTFPTYMLVIHNGVATAKRSPAYISHFVTCPQRDQFRKDKGGTKDGDELLREGTPG